MRAVKSEVGRNKAETQRRKDAETQRLRLCGAVDAPNERASVLECGTPVPLWGETLERVRPPDGSRTAQKAALSRRTPKPDGMVDASGEGSVLVGLLWCLALLSIAVMSVLHTSRMDLLVVKNYGDRVQARYLALAGVERAKALLYHDLVQRRQTGKNHTGALYDDESRFRDVTLGRGRYRVFHDGGDGTVYGISDEESRINVNFASAAVLTKINGLSAEMAASIINWRGAQTQAGAAGGANADYYANLTPPYQPRNAPLETVRELLMVRGIEPQQLLGDSATNLDSGDDDKPLEDGWSSILTVNSMGDNVNASGKDRIDVQQADQSQLTSVSGITADIAQAIIAARGRNQFKSIADLLDVQPTNQPAGNTGSSLIDDQLLTQIGDDITVGSDNSQAGLINVNTASVDVLTCLPGMNDTLARAVISYRESTGFMANIAWLLRVDGMTHDIFKQVAPLVTARSETFRITSEGEVPSTETRQRVQVIIHVGPDQVQTLSYRDDL